MSSLTRALDLGQSLLLLFLRLHPILIFYSIPRPRPLTAFSHPLIFLSRSFSGSSGSKVCTSAVLTFESVSGRVRSQPKRPRAWPARRADPRAVDSRMVGRDTLKPPIWGSAMRAGMYMCAGKKGHARWLGAAWRGWSWSLRLQNQLCICCWMRRRTEGLTVNFESFELHATFLLDDVENSSGLVADRLECCACDMGRGSVGGQADDRTSLSCQLSSGQHPDPERLTASRSQYLSCQLRYYHLGLGDLRC